MISSIWGTQSCLNNLHDNKLFFLALRNHQAAKAFQYQAPSSTNLKITQKIKIVFEKILISFLAIIPRARKKVRRAFVIVQNHKDNHAGQNPPLGAAPPGSPLPSAPPFNAPPFVIVQNHQDNLGHQNPPPDAPLPSTPPLSAPLPSAPPTPLPAPNAPSDLYLSIQANKVSSAVVHGVKDGSGKSQLSVNENFTKMFTLSTNVWGSIEDVVSMNVMKSPVMIPCGHIQESPNPAEFSNQKTPNGLPKISSPQQCSLCCEKGRTIDFVIPSDQLATIIEREDKLLAELESLTEQHKMLSEQVENLKFHQVHFTAGNVDKLATTTLNAQIPVLEEEEKGSVEFIKDPVMLLCGHIHSLEVAKQQFGEITKNGKEQIAEGFPEVPRPGNCSTCKARVLTYLETPALRNTMTAGNELLAHKKLLNETIAALTHELKALQSPDFVQSDNMGIASASSQQSKELKEMEEAAIQDNKFRAEMLKNPPPEEPSDFTCNRPWTGLTLEEEEKYRSERIINGKTVVLKPVRWFSLKNSLGSDSLIYYVRILGFEDGSIEVRLMSAHKDSFQKYLDKFKFILDSSPEEAGRTTKNDLGQVVSVGVFIARTPDEIKFALSLLMNNNNIFKEPKLFALAKRLMLHPENWNVVEDDEHTLITSAKKIYDVDNVRRARLKEEDKRKKALENAANNKASVESDEAIIAQDAEARRIIEQVKADELLAEELQRSG